MLDDFDMIQHRFEGNDDLKIYPISDVHLGAAEHMEKEWYKFCDEIRNEPNSYITLGGDLINNALKTSVSNVYEEKIRPREQKRIIAEMLMPIREKILCAVSGNHERRSMKDSDDDPTYDIMCKLDLEHLYRPNMAFVKIRIGNVDADGTRNPTYILVVTHGTGGGIYTGGAVNRGERFGYIIDGMDCLILGHTHKPYIIQPAKIKIDPYNNQISFKPFKVVSCSSWLNYGGYAAAAMLSPASHAPEIITLSGKKKQISVEML